MSLTCDSDMTTLNGEYTVKLQIVLTISAMISCRHRPPSQYAPVTISKYFESRPDRRKYSKCMKTWSLKLFLMVTEAYYENGLYPTQKSVTKLTVCANERIIRELVRFLRYVYLTSESSEAYYESGL